MTDKFADLRAALAMGPTPGPFSVSRSYSPGNQELILRLTYKDEHGIAENYCTVRNRLGDTWKTEANAAYIAACDPNTIRELLAERDQLAAALEAAREDAEPVVRFNDDGTLDEVVGRGQFHLEQMGSGHWWMQLGPHIVNLSARGKIRAHFGRNEAAIDAAMEGEK